MVVVLKQWYVDLEELHSFVVFWNVLRSITGSTKTNPPHQYIQYYIFSVWNVNFIYFDQVHFVNSEDIFIDIKYTVSTSTKTQLCANSTTV